MTGLARQRGLRAAGDGYSCWKDETRGPVLGQRRFPCNCFAMAQSKPQRSHGISANSVLQSQLANCHPALCGSSVDLREDLGPLRQGCFFLQERDVHAEEREFVWAGKQELGVLHPVPVHGVPWGAVGP